MPEPSPVLSNIPPGFARRLLRWADDLDRPLPWRGEKDPYKIWLSEMLLQQTRADQAAPYYYRFLQAFPDVHALAAARMDIVLKLWEGLGYYNRAHHLHNAAVIISQQFKGIFPDTYEGLLALPGIGPYTAAAIASFAFDGKHPVMDGNVIRVLARMVGFADRVDTSASKNTLLNLATNAMGTADPASFNQAIMDFGAVQCTPRVPACPSCPFARQCVAWTTGEVGNLPFKKQKAPLQNRYFLFYVAERGGRIWLVQRGQSDIWRNMYTFPEMEYTGNFPADITTAAMDQLRDWTGLNPATKDFNYSNIYQQVLTHQRIHARFISALLPARAKIPVSWVPVDNRNFTKFALPKIMNMYLSENLDIR
ncbi:MAG: A/G-specific adenine glycosylase [Saprospiraceae bacterium]|nr:A/G-specific adenine glycosylase [Saprospiraceae bacterium]